MAKEGSGVVPASNFLFLVASVSLAASQSAPPFYAGSYLESSDGQAGEAGGGFYYGSPPQHFYYPDGSEYLNTNSYHHASSPYQEEARIASYGDGTQFYPQQGLYNENFSMNILR